MSGLLQQEIDNASRTVVTDSYPISIGEIVNIYRDGELNIHPEFQRLYRWDDDQKSKFIESILLGIPVPPIFVYQAEKNVWEVIDGLQRLSTIFQFIGILKNSDGDLYPPLLLKATHFLPSMKGFSWKSDNPSTCFDESLQILFKRKKLHFNILTPGSDISTKYDLFDRLNSGGLQLEPQEIRNCLIIMSNRDFYREIELMSASEHFKSCMPLSERDFSEQQDKEFIVRYFLVRSADMSSVSASDNMNALLTKEIIRLAEMPLEVHHKIIRDFYQLFNLLSTTLGEDSFKRWKVDKHVGPVLIGAFEAIVPGVSSNLEYWSRPENATELIRKVRSIYESPTFVAATERGVRPADRFKRLSDLSLELFKNEQN